MSRACNFFFFFLSEPASFLYQIFLDQNLLVLSMASEFFLNIYLACLVKFLRTGTIFYKVHKNLVTCDEHWYIIYKNFEN